MKYKVIVGAISLKSKKIARKEEVVDEKQLAGDPKLLVRLKYIEEVEEKPEKEPKKNPEKESKEKPEKGKTTKK